MTGRKFISPPVAALITKAILTHASAAGCSTNQAREVLEREKNLDDLLAVAEEEEDDPATRATLLNRLAIFGTWRAVHELEAATHAAALTNIGLALADLEAQDVDIGGFLATSESAAVLFRMATEEDDEPGGNGGNGGVKR